MAREWLAMRLLKAKDATRNMSSALCVLAEGWVLRDYLRYFKKRTRRPKEKHIVALLSTDTSSQENLLRLPHPVRMMAVVNDLPTEVLTRLYYLVRKSQTLPPVLLESPD